MAIETKSELDCKNKYFQLVNIMQREGMTSNFREIFNFVQQQQPKQEDLIDWSKWNNEQISVDQAKAKWSILKRRIQHRKGLSWPRLLEKI